MADDRKRDESVCAKITERMLIDMNRVLVAQDVKASAWLYGLIRRELYGLAGPREIPDGQQGLPRE